MTQKSTDPAESSTASKKRYGMAENGRLQPESDIAKHAAPAQVKVNPQAAKRELIGLSLEKLLNASEDKSPNQE